MNEINPEPPHISVSVYSSILTEAEVFRSMYLLVRDMGGSSSYMDVAPKGQQFDAVSDLADVLKKVEIGGGANASCPLREDGEVVCAYMSVKRFGPILIKYELARPPDRHPVSIVLGAGALGIPLEYLNPQDRVEARRIGIWARDLFRAACEKIDPLYGELAIEHTMAAPNGLLNSDSVLDGEVYLSRRVAQDGQSFFASLQDDYGVDVVTEWKTGFYISGWWGFGGRVLDADLRELSRRVTGFFVDRLRYI